MQMRTVSSACSYALLVAVLLSGCAGPVNLPEALGGPDTEAQRAVVQFRAENMNYDEIGDARKEIERTVAAVHGWGRVEHEDGPLTAYLNSILKRIVAVSPVSDVPVRVVVADVTESPVALAMKDGTIYIPIKLLADMNDNPALGSEDTLAFLLAHEVAHILYYHFSSDVFGDIFETVLFAGEVGYSVIQNFDAGQESARNVGDLYRKVRLARLVEETALSPAWTRKQEYEADLLGFDLMTRAGYNPEAAYDFMDFLQAYEEWEESRRSQARQAAEKSLEQDVKEGNFGELFSKVLSQTVEEVTTTLSRKHARVGERRKTLARYHERWSDEFADAEDVDYRNLGWQEDVSDEKLDQAVAVDRMRRIFDNYRSSREAISALVDGDLDDAEKLVEKALSGPTQYSPYPRVVAAIYCEERGDRECAMEHIRVALKEGPGASFAVYRKLLEYVPDGHLAILDDAEQQFGRFVGLMQYRAAILEKLGRDHEAQTVRNACYYENATSKNRHECHKKVEL